MCKKKFNSCNVNITGDVTATLVIEAQKDLQFPNNQKHFCELWTTFMVSKLLWTCLFEKNTPVLT